LRTSIALPALLAVALTTPPARAGECVPPDRLLQSADRAQAAGQLAAARALLPRLLEGARCTPAVDTATLARLWWFQGWLAAEDGQDDAARTSFAAAARSDRERSPDSLSPAARRAYDEAIALPAQEGVVRLAPEHVQYAGTIDGTPAIFPLKLPAGLHFVAVRLTDGSDQRFGDFIVIPARESLRVRTGLAEDIDQWVPVERGGTFVAPARDAVVATPPSGDDLLPTDLSATPEALSPLTKDQFRFLRPRLARLDPVPRSQVDYTAYALEWGEVKLGAGTIAIGALPRTHVGTQGALWLLGVQNGFAKADLLRVGPLDVALNARIDRLPMGDFLAQMTGGGATTSLILLPAWSLHAGVDYNHVLLRGEPDLSHLSPLLSSLASPELQAWSLPEGAVPPDAAFSAQTIAARFATDLRLNRRDSFVLRGSWITWAHVQQTYVVDDIPTDVIPPILNLDAALSHEGAVPAKDTYVASLAYQLSGRQLDLRVGVGLSAVPYTWILQSAELSYRFGGKTRWREARIRNKWREARQEASS